MIAAERRKSLNAKEIKAQRKNAVFASTGKYTEGWDDQDVMMSPRRSSQSDHAAKPVKKKKSKVGKKEDDMSMSGHSAMASKEFADFDFDEKHSPTAEATRDSKVSDNAGKLGKMLGEAKPLKKRGARTVASMPATPEHDSSTRRENSERREGSRKAMKSRAQSPGPMKRRAASPGPMKEKSKSTDTMTMAKNKAPTSPKRRPTLVARSKSTSYALENNGDQGQETTGPNLEKLLGAVDASNPKKKLGAKSVASAPALERKPSRRTRPTSRPSLPNRRSRSIDDAEPLVTEEVLESPKRRRARSVDDADLGSDEEEDLKEPEQPSSPKTFSYRLSKRLNSFRKLAGLAGGDKSKTDRGREFQNMDSSEQAPKRPSRALSRSNAVGQKRSNSAGPLTNRPALRRDREDRRQGLSKSKETNGTPSKAQGDESDEEDDPRTAPQRAQSMMLHREATRRGKSNSLMDLVNYSEEEIHSTSYFASNHVLVNRERMKRGLRPLTRNIAMDELARENAKRMAQTGGVTPIPATYVGNVLRGESIRAIHRAIMQNKEGRERANLLNPYFQDFGVGTSKSEDGMLYICQLFSERLELTVTDTTI